LKLLDLRLWKCVLFNNATQNNFGLGLDGLGKSLEAFALGEGAITEI